MDILNANIADEPSARGNYPILEELGSLALISNNITLPTVKTTLAYIKRNHFLVHHRSLTSRGASDSYQLGTSQAYDI